MKIESAYFSKKGNKDRNEDSVLPLFDFDGAFWAAIADGMGGRPGGDVASRTVIDAIKEAISSRQEADMSKLFSIAQDCLRVIADEKPDLIAMGTTLSLLRLSKDKAEVGHVGDSRIYQLRSDGLVDRTVDQTEVEQLVQQGVLNRVNARRYPRRHILLSVLSASKEYDLHTETFEIKAGDRLVLLTDGVSSKMLRKEIRDLSLQEKSPQLFCDALAKEIEKRLPRDDYSAVCLDIKLE